MSYISKYSYIIYLSFLFLHAKQFFLKCSLALFLWLFGCCWFSIIFNVCTIVEEPRCFVELLILCMLIPIFEAGWMLDFIKMGILIYCLLYVEANSLSCTRWNHLHRNLLPVFIFSGIFVSIQCYPYLPTIYIIINFILRQSNMIYFLYFDEQII